LNKSFYLFFILILNIVVLQATEFNLSDSETSETNVIAVRKDWPVLASLLDRALASIPHNDLPSDLINHEDPTVEIRDQSSQVGLTAEEIEWIKNHPTIIVGAETDYPPYSYSNNTSVVGFHNAYVSFIAEKAGFEAEFLYGPKWSELIKMIKNKDIDLISGMSYKQSREEFINFTDSYLSDTEYLIVNEKDSLISSLSDMRGKKIACVKGYSVKAKILNKFPDITIVDVKSSLEAVIAVSEGTADGYVDYLGVINYFRREYLIDNLRIADTDVFSTTTNTHIGIRKDGVILRNIFAKVMATVTPHEYEKLKNEWFAGENEKKGKFKLSLAEREYIKSLGTLRMGINKFWVPIQFIGDDGNHQGISSEYVKIIEKKLGLKFEIVFDSWENLLTSTKSGGIDFLPLVSPSASRSEYLNFTEPVLKTQIIIGTHSTASFYSGLDDLAGETVGVGAGYYIEDRLSDDFPEIQTKGFSSLEDAIISLKKQKITAVVGNSAVFTYYRNKWGFKNSVHINNTTPYEYEQSMGVSHKYSPLIPILNRLIASMPEEQHEFISEKWINLQVRKHTDWKMVWMVGGISLITLLIVLIWSLTLSKEVKKRRDAEFQLAESDERFDSIFSKISDVVIILDREFKLIHANEHCLDFFDLKKKNIIGENIDDVFHLQPHIISFWPKRAKEVFTEGKKLYFEDLFSYNNSPMSTEETFAPHFTDSGHIYAVSIICKNVTERYNDQAQLKKYAETQAILLREVNHRVKNNLSAIISMLHMEVDTIKTFDCTNLCLVPLGTLEKRINSLLIVHSMLSSSEWQPLKVSDICKNIIEKSFAGTINADKYEINVQGCDEPLSSDQSHSLALVISELSINTTKYAKPTDKKLIVSVMIKRVENSIELSYSDNGPGFPDSILKGESPKNGGLGIGIIAGLVQGNLNGSHQLTNNSGALTSIKFPTEENTQLIEEDLV
jgi:PAS domain S-box-containing protein